jgi:membrane fusion protein, multidrug efflux system
MDQPHSDLAPSQRPAPSPEPVRSVPQDRPPRRRWWLWLVVALVLLVAAWAAWRFFGTPGRSAPGRAGKVAEAAQPVGVAKADVGDMNVVLTGLGTVTPLATVTVQTQIDGLLMSVGYQEGQIVNKGDFLAQIDPRPFEVALAQAQGTLAHDQGLLDQAKSDLTRFVTLGYQDSIAQQTVQDQKFLVQQDEGTVALDKASVDSAKLNLTYCHIVSPVTGRVGLRLIDPGNYIQTSTSSGLVVVTQLQPISVVFVLPEDDIPEVAEQMRNGHALTVSAYDRSDAKKLADGSLITVDNTIDTTTGAVKLRASFPNDDNALFPNQFVNSRLLLNTLQNVVRAPAAAVQQGAPGSFVYVVKPDSTVGIQVVKTGVTDGDQIQILSGLKSGDTVVVDGADRLKDGAKVTVAPEAANSASTPNTGPGAPPGQQPSGSKNGQ